MEGSDRDREYKDSMGSVFKAFTIESGDEGRQSVTKLQLKSALRRRKLGEPREEAPGSLGAVGGRGGKGGTSGLK